MATLVGTQTELTDALRSLAELDYDAAEAYQAAINRISNNDYKSKLEEFYQDHKNHIEKITSVLKKHGIPVNPDQSIKKWLTQGKVVIANILGDKAILNAMLSNELDTNTAYNTLNNRTDVWDDIQDIIKKGLEDEKKHKEWLETTINSQT